MRRFQLKSAVKLFILSIFICSFIAVYLFTELLENEKLKFKLSPQKPESFDKFVSNLVSEMTVKNYSKTVDWNVTKSWINSRQIHPNNAEYYGQILQRMNSENIVSASAGDVGTQIKMMLMLEGGQKVLFKPMVVQRDFVANSSPYAGVDRHNCEIASFHLNRLFNFRRCPLVVGRKVNLLTEIYNVADSQLKKTFYRKGKNLCFYGVCHYCRRSEAICADENNILEGAIILWIPHSLKKYKHPWSRTYKKNVLAKWEKNNDYCTNIKELSQYKTGPRLLDLIDTAIFDFISGNADRHHYETLNGFLDGVVLLLDNGKSFGNPFNDELSILAPLQQCCIVRQSTWNRLNQFPNIENALSTSMRLILSKDPVSPILTESHLNSMDRRLKTVMLEIEKCVSKHGKNIIINDNL